MQNYWIHHYILFFHRETTLKEKYNYVNLNLVIALLLALLAFMVGIETAKDNRVS